MSIKSEIFPYSWCIDEKEVEVTSIRIYGLDSQNKNVCLRINDFTPYVYIELPTTFKWNEGNSKLLVQKIDEIMGKNKPLKKVFQMKKKLYGANINISSNERKLFPYIFCAFSSHEDIKILNYKINRPLLVPGIGNVRLKIHESDADPILQLTSIRDIPTAGWVSYSGDQVAESERLTNCDYELNVKWRSLGKSSNENAAKPKIMAFDIEVNSSNPATMPKSARPEDKVFQISCVFVRDGSKDVEKYLLTLFEPTPELVGEDVNIFMYDTEADLLIGFTDLINNENPNIISGYNIFGFDIPYMIERAQHCLCYSTFNKMGFLRFGHAKLKTIKWSSSAYKNQEFKFLDAEGRLFVDLLPLVRRDFKLENYKLKTISEFFLGKEQTKDPLTVQGIFKCYKLGLIGNKENATDKQKLSGKKAMAIVGKYCVQDSYLIVKLMDKLQTWIALCEMATVCCVPIFTLYTQGQQVKVYSQVYKYCCFNNIVVEKDAYETRESDRYVGAYVVDPIPGVYDKVVPFDFSSMYPSIIIAYNIDPSTWVTDDSVPDDVCHVMEWEDHVSCEHDPKVIRRKQLSLEIEKIQAEIKKLREKRDKSKLKDTKQKYIDEIEVISQKLSLLVKERSDLVKTVSKYPMCEKRKYRFLKEPRGVFPTVLTNLLDARKNTRLKMKDINNSYEGKDMPEDVKIFLNILDKRQLSYKISCNSMYGAMGVRRGYLPFMPGAMCTTYIGRTSIKKVSETIQTNFKGKLIYGDSDSSYQSFPHLETAQETWEYARYVSNEVSKLFPPPMKLEFEEVIYWRFFILTKKRYMYRSCDDKGNINLKIGKKGVLLARRDNSALIRSIYEQVIIKIFNGECRDNILYYIIQQLNTICSNTVNYKDFVITKSVGSTQLVGDGPVDIISNEKGEKQGYIGDYKVSLLPSNSTEKLKQFKLKNVSTEEEYYLRCLPAQVQLAELMRLRGQRVDPGTRLEYVIIDTGNKKGRQYEKIESADYFSAHKNVICIDFFYYIKLLSTPLDQVLNITYENKKDENGKMFKKNFVYNQYLYRSNIRSLVLDELKQMFTPKIIVQK